MSLPILLKCCPAAPTENQPANQPQQHSTASGEEQTRERCRLRYLVSQDPGHTDTITPDEQVTRLS